MDRVWKFKSQGMSWNRISRSLGVGKKTVRSIVCPSYVEKRKATQAARGVRVRP